MSNAQPIATQVPVWLSAIDSARDKFASSPLVFDEQKIFVTGLLHDNQQLMQHALSNPGSLKMAMYNVAAIGLTLNPAQNLAYLVPRKIARDQPVKICLDISYRGLITIGVEAGAIRWAKVELVYEQDTFEYNGPSEPPLHRCDPFSKERGEVVGGYCIAELANGGYLIEVMSRAEIDQVKASSSAGNSKFGPWAQWPKEMMKKTILKRAAKWWPKSSPRLSEAVRLLNEENGEGLAERHPVQREAQSESKEQLLPPAPAREDVDPTIVSHVDMMCAQAECRGTWSSVEDAFRVRYRHDPEMLSFALHTLANLRDAELVIPGDFSDVTEPEVIDDQD